DPTALARGSAVLSLLRDRRGKGARSLTVGERQTRTRRAVADRAREGPESPERARVGRGPARGTGEALAPDPAAARIHRAAVGRAARADLEGRSRRPLPSPAG